MNKSGKNSIVEQLHKAIADKVLDYLENESYEKILLINSPQGSGKTITTLKTVLNLDNIFVYLGGNHYFVDNTIRQNKQINNSDIFHLKGRNARIDLTDPDGRRMCQNPLMNVITQSNVSTYELLCDKEKGNCQYKSECEYLKQYKKLFDEPQSFGSVYQFLNTSFLEDYDYDFLILDEDPLGGLCNAIRFNQNHLNKLVDIMGKILFELQHGTPEDLRTDNDKTDIGIPEIGIIHYYIFRTIGALKQILGNLDKKYITGKEFIDLFFQYNTIKKEELKDLFDNPNKQYAWGMDDFYQLYEEIIYSLFNDKKSDDYADFNNILHEIVDIIKMCLKYDGKDVNIPIFAVKHGKQKNEIVLYNIRKELPNKHVIILDATGSAELYEHIFNRGVIEFNPAVDIQRNIIQITDGLYPKQSLYHERTRERVYWIVLGLIDHWIKHEACNKVFVITHKSYSTIENETPQYDGMSIERYLKSHDIPDDQFEVSHFQLMMGMNIEELMQNGKLIIIGTPEPNPDEFLQSVSVWYEGEEHVSNERADDYESSYRYVDERYHAHLRTQREHVLEHNVERVRFLFPGHHKQVVIFSNLPLQFKTTSKTIKDLIDEYNLRGQRLKHNPTYRALSWLEKIEPISMRDFNNHVRNWKHVKDGVQFRDDLIENGYIEAEVVSTERKPRTMVKVSKKGKKWIKHIEKLTGS